MTGKLMAHPGYILPVGTTNFSTGKNSGWGSIFNLWTEGDGTYLLVKEQPWFGEVEKPKFKAIITCQTLEETQEQYVVGDRIHLRHDQSNKDMGNWEILGAFPNTKDGLLEMKEVTGKSGCPFATFK